MNKQDFLNKLKVRLSNLPKQDVEERLNFYSEMIDDRIEEGLSEEEAVSQIGSVDEVVSQIIADIPLTKIIKEKAKQKRKLKPWEIVLLALGSPVWASLLISAFAVIFSLYVAIWSVVASLWAVFASLVACAPFGIVAGIVFALSGNGLSGAAMVGAGIFCAGLSILLFFGCKAVTGSTLLLTKRIALGIKHCFLKKEVAYE